jgi:hypothetical protein
MNISIRTYLVKPEQFACRLSEHSRKHLGTSKILDYQPVLV